jgi:hypothetical protein
LAALQLLVLSVLQLAVRHGVDALPKRSRIEVPRDQLSVQ